MRVAEILPTPYFSVYRYQLKWTEFLIRYCEGSSLFLTKADTIRRSGVKLAICITCNPSKVETGPILPEIFIGLSKSSTSSLFPLMMAEEISTTPGAMTYVINDIFGNLFQPSP